jgi:hypothetical protein
MRYDVFHNLPCTLKDYRKQHDKRRRRGGRMKKKMIERALGTTDNADRGSRGGLTEKT